MWVLQENSATIVRRLFGLCYPCRFSFAESLRLWQTLAPLALTLALRACSWVYDPVSEGAEISRSGIDRNKTDPISVSRLWRRGQAGFGT